MLPPAMPLRQEINHPVYTQIHRPKNGYIKLIWSKLKYTTRFHIPIATVPNVPLQIVHSILSCVVHCPSTTILIDLTRPSIVTSPWLTLEIAYTTTDILTIILWSLHKNRKRNAAGLAAHWFVFSKYSCNIVNCFSSKFLAIILR